MSREQLSQYCLGIFRIVVFLAVLPGVTVSAWADEAAEPDMPAVIVRSFSDDAAGLNVGIATLHAQVPDVAGNKARIVAALKQMKQQGVNMALFPEFALTGYFWEDEKSCRPYMEANTMEKQQEWVDKEIRPLLDDTLQYVLLNGLRRNPAGGKKFLNSTFVISKSNELFDDAYIYDKTFLPGIENSYTVSGKIDSLVLDTQWGRFGVITCYDLCFPRLLEEYAVYSRTDGLLMLASWRGPALRDYPQLNRRSDWYYGYQLELMGAAMAALNQNWLLLSNAVGRHAVSKAVFAGASSVWAPSGITLVDTPPDAESLLVVKGLTIKQTHADELEAFDYTEDFLKVYNKLPQLKAFSRFGRDPNETATASLE